jgi:uncharacterized membrane protein
VKRELVLILIDVVLYYLAWIDTIAITIWLQVLWAIGVSMIGLSLVSRLNDKVIGALDLLNMFGYKISSITALYSDNFGHRHVLTSLI